MRTVEIVSHCWRFSRCLAYQLSSLILHPPTRVRVTYRLFYSPEDMPTVEMLAWFDEKLNFPAIYSRCTPLPLPQLLRREIGRNMAARATTADLVWFADVDYAFGPGCLDALADIRLEDSSLFYPRQIWTCKTHAIGDEYARRVNVLRLYDVDHDDFMPQRFRYAIGGLQLVPGDVARRVGYCDEPRYQHPVTDGKWQVTRGDVGIRKTLGTKGLAVDVPSLYRIRQATPGVVDTLPALS